MNPSTTPTVAILLCTYNGQRYLRDQLDSVAAQTYPHWVMWASDDGSQDDTLSILAEYRAKWSQERLSVVHGPSSGFAANFLSLACNPSIQADYYAFCDQDDIWDSDKLQRAVNWLSSVPANIPALYGSRMHLVDENNIGVSLSPLFTRQPCFVHSLTQNFANGNTMVFNHAACNLLRTVGHSVTAVAHDWWLYLLVAGAGGNVFYDSRAYLRYRQHSTNLIGMETHWLTRMLRLQTVRAVWQGKFRNGNDGQLRSLMCNRGILAPRNQQLLDKFFRARSRWLLPRLLGFWQVGIYREPLWSHLGLIAAALLKKI
ncbi:MAG: glycosyltransferase family 2 protein [Candidatus Thiothrix putei]|uniref:Glycosyltransferase family 2 protein n=1 Tax=Candidatus Thiothrix putei TaxID=3080811 RepID=A0AA95HCL1_9GAMM|nr:MAG: glycosyltransferase family 2 protein [Candidatus Thiothrix putei]